MLDLITFYNDIKLPAMLSGEMAALILLVFFCLFSLWEHFFPHRKQPEKRAHHIYGANISLFVVNSTVMSLLSVSSLFILAEHYSNQGLLHYLSSPVLQAAVSFLLLDLLLYGWHKACHRFDSLWMFHRVHHNDPYLNTSTSFRIHILELLITHLLKALYIILSGVDQAMMIINETIITLFTMFHHSNINFIGEKLLGHLIIVPYLHRAHHSRERNEHDSNYGAVLSIWDQMFGTRNEREPVVIGIKEHSPQDVINLLKFGFNQHAPAPGQYPLPGNLEAMIAEAAYYKAEKRNFYPGYELLDWLEAKKDILKLIYGDNFVDYRQVRRKTSFQFFRSMDFNRHNVLRHQG